MSKLLEVAHIALEYKAGVGGIKSVTTGLIPALAKSGEVKPAMITPFYDVYYQIYKNKKIEYVTTITHIYKGAAINSDVCRVCTEVIDDIPVYHYLIKPVPGSSVPRIFDIGAEKDIYQNFLHSSAFDRLEYFNGAAGVLLRWPHDLIPEWDLVHEHTWHTGLSGCIAKELEYLEAYKAILNRKPKALKKVPHIVSTVHMLRRAEHGELYNATQVKNFFASLGFPENFASQFPAFAEHVNSSHVKRVVLALLYADTMNTVSRGLAADIVSGKGEGLDALLANMHQQKRVYGITNGIDVSMWLATNPANLQEYTFNLESISASRLRLKQHLANKYPKLDPNKKWFIYIGRFANEKGVDYLPDLLQAVKKVNGNLLVLGSHVVYIEKDGKKISRYQDLVDTINADPCAIVVDNPQEQEIHGKALRAASDCAVSLSKNEACGLVPMELMTCGAISVVPNIQGLPDTVTCLEKDPINGTGFLFDGALENRAHNLEQAIKKAAHFLNVKEKNGTIDNFAANLIRSSLKYDWSATSVREYIKLYKQTLLQDLLTAPRIRKLPKIPMLNQYRNKYKPIKIWQIGFNKCGSSTLFEFFWKNDIISIHHGNKGSLATSMYTNFLCGRPLLDPEYLKYQAFFDVENKYTNPPIYIHELFKEIDKQYPGSKFILNTRNKADWIKSRLAHVDPTNGAKYAEVLCDKYGITREELIQRWSDEWDQHHKAVLEHFKHRPQDLLVYNIDTDKPEKICEFFKDYFELDPNFFGHQNKTPKERLVLK